VNTCSFIESAADESIDTILALGAYKKQGNCRRLIVAGCLPQRHGPESARAMPEVDLFLGTGAYGQIAAAVLGDMVAGTCLLPDPDIIDVSRPVLRTPFAPHSAYIKIAEGCARHCTYCIIPKLRGRQKSRPPEAIEAEAKALIAGGVKELTLVAQETTAYGRDGDSGYGLADLLERLAVLDETVWIRFLYGHPQSLGQNVLDTVARFDNLCPYFDIPIQHASTAVLRRMGRRYSTGDLLRLFDAIRTAVPEAVLRTTVLLGFPGETESDFEQLIQFIDQVKFDHLGAFAYSDAVDLASHHLEGHVDGTVADHRVEDLMLHQIDISSRNLTRYLGRDLDVLVEEGPEEGVWKGRSLFQAPEVDGQVLIHVDDATTVKLIAGTIIPVRIVETLEYDLVAQPL
jgi:ribosomal protein S12 methylthiotransferase